jgi:uncharacterized protein with HEPN domain
LKADDVVRIRHMIEAAESALRFIAGKKRVDLDSDEMLRFALVRAVEILGEAAARISSETRSATPAVPWSDAVRMRNRLVHVCFDVDHTILWKTVTEDTPALLPLLRPLVPRS